jgi:hypothetical protein
MTWVSNLSSKGIYQLCDSGLAKALLYIGYWFMVIG